MTELESVTLKRWADNLVDALHSLEKVWENCPNNGIVPCGNLETTEEGFFICDGLYALAEATGSEVQVCAYNNFYKYKHYFVYREVKFFDIRTNDLRGDEYNDD